MEFIRNAEDENGILRNRIQIEPYKLNGNNEIAFKVLETVRIQVFRFQY